MLKLNETPIRTSRNYGINNIKLNDVAIPNDLQEFDGLTIKGEDIIVNQDKIDLDLKYGNGLDEQKSNLDIELKINSKDASMEFDLSEDNPNLVENILIEMAEKRNSNLIIKFESKDDTESYHNGKIKIIAKKDSKLNITFINMINDFSNNFIAIENELEENAEVNYTYIDFGGKNSITNYYTNLKGSNSKNNINTIYLGTQDKIIDINYIAEAYGEKSEINMNLKGAIKDNCKKHFKGTIDFKKGCKKAKGDENEYCTILSEKAKSISLPMLLCTEEDIEGNHSAAAGKIDSKQLFYLMSRGFSIADAQKLIVRAQFNEVLDKIEDEEIRNEILDKIDIAIGDGEV